MAPGPDPGAARIHWLVAGRFSTERGGGSWVATPSGLDDQLRGRVPEVKAVVPDRLGAGERRELVLRPTSLQAFTLAGVVEAVPELKALRAIAQRPPAPADVVAAVEKVVGPGRLSTACAAGPVRDALDAAVFGTALDVLADASVRAVESAWRGLRLLLAACPEGSGIQVEVLEVEPGSIAPAVRARPASDAFDEPDAIFVVQPVETIETLAALADLGEEVLAPVVASPDPALAGATDLDALAASADRKDPEPEAWAELRALPAARWLTCAVNRVVLHAEGAGAFRRTCLGSPVWAVAAMLSASYRAQGAFAALVGRAGALTAPGTWSIPSGRQKGTVAPTGTFLSIPAQDALAARGLLALGSIVGSDRVVAVAAPAVAAGKGVAPLPAQILTGRIVRFARWAKGQVDPSATQDEVSTLLAQAAGLFLFPAMSGAAAIGARVKGEGAARVLEFGARVNPSHALVPLEIAFELPI